MTKTNAPYDGEKFDNIEPFKDKSFGDLLKWRFSSEGRSKWPEWIETKQVKPTKERVSGEIIRYLPINHATILIQTQGLNILTDPLYSKRTSPVSWAGPKRSRAPAVRLEDLPPIDIVVISHNHYDHFDLPTLKYLEEKFHPTFYVGLKNGKLLKDEGIKTVIELDWWQTEKHGAIDVTFVPAQHWSARGLFDRFEMLWGGFYLTFKETNIYFAGDTGYGKFFKMIKEKLGSPDLAFLPIGAYEPRWFMKNAHMNPEDAVNAHHDLEAKHSVGMHFETIQLTDEAFETPRKEFHNAWDASQKIGTFIAPEFGTEYDLEIGR